MWRWWWSRTAMLPLRWINRCASLESHQNARYLIFSSLHFILWPLCVFCCKHGSCLRHIELCVCVCMCLFFLYVFIELIWVFCVLFLLKCGFLRVLFHEEGFTSCFRQLFRTKTTQLRLCIVTVHQHGIHIARIITLSCWLTSLTRCATFVALPVRHDVPLEWLLHMSRCERCKCKWRALWPVRIFAVILSLLLLFLQTPKAIFGSTFTRRVCCRKRFHYKPLF